jgi:hypothetical protein
LQDAINAQSEARVNAAVNGTKVDPRTQTDAAARATAAAATAPRAVAFAPAPTALTPQQLSASGAPSDAFNGLVTTQGTTAFARPAGSPAMAGAGIYDNGKNTKSATPRTDQVMATSAGLDKLMPGMGAMNTALAKVTGNASMLAGANTADPNSIASQAKAATNAKAPMPPTSAVKTEGTGLVDQATGVIGIVDPFAGLAAQGTLNAERASERADADAASAANKQAEDDAAAAASGAKTADAIEKEKRARIASENAKSAATDPFVRNRGAMGFGRTGF